MSDVSIGWVDVELGEVAQIIRGVTYKSEHSADVPKDGFLAVLRATNITGEVLTFDNLVYVPSKNVSTKQLLLQGDVVIASSSGSKEIVGKAGSFLGGSFVGSFGAFCTGLRPSTFLSPTYFRYYFQTPAYRKSVSALSAGSNINNLKTADLASQHFPLPPAVEQSRIVEKLEELLSDLDAAVVELRAAQKKLGQYRQSLLKAAVEGKLTAEWRAAQKFGAGESASETGAQLLERILQERRTRWEAKQLAKFESQGKIPPKGWQKKYPEPVQPDTSDLPKLPDGWVWASVDQCSLDESAITDGPFGSNLKSSHYQETGPRVIRLQNIGDGVFHDAKAHISHSHYIELLKHAVQEGDLVIAMLGEILPRACMIPNGVAPAIVKADCARVRVNQSLIKPTILMSQLNSKPVRDAVAKFVKGIGRPRVNLGHIRAIPIALCSVEEQLQMEGFMSIAQQSIDRQNDALDLSFEQSAAQRKNILKAAFSGKLVPQDPNDEPASVLLERIRIERAEREKQPKVGKSKPKKEIAAMVRTLKEVLAEAGDWVPAQEAFRRCGVTDGAETEQLETLYAELRELHVVEKRVQVKPESDEHGRKTGDLLKLIGN